MLMAPENAFGLAVWKMLVTPDVEASSCSDPSWASAHIHSEFIPVVPYTAQLSPVHICYTFTLIFLNKKSSQYLQYQSVKLHKHLQ